METVLLTLALLACPVGMLAMGAIGWLWTKRSGGTKGDENPSMGSAQNAGGNERAVI